MSIEYLSDYAPYQRGAFDMYLRLKNVFYKEANVIDKAIWKMLEDQKTRQRFLKHEFEEIGLKNHKYKNKRLVSVEACLMVWDNKNGWHENLNETS